MEILFRPALLIAALSSLVVGFIWYNPKVFGTIWMKEAGITRDPNDKPNMALILGQSVVYAYLISFILQFNVIHQMGAMSATMDVPNVDPSVLKNYLAAYGETFRTFKHGALHGTMVGLLLILPSIGIPAMYEKRSFKYVLVTGGYWVITCMIMGGIICAWK